MAKTVKIDQLADEITKAIREYTEEVSEAIFDAVDETAKECLGEIKANSPKRRGKYAKGWTIQKERGRLFARRTVWNKKHYRLVHLLEKGHAKRSGGRVAGIPHVGPAEEKYNKKLVERIEKIIERGGR